MLSACAQAGCPACVERLLRPHAGLVRWVIRCASRRGLPAGALWQAGGMALWQAILHYAPGCGLAFSTYAVPTIRQRLWRVVAPAARAQGYLGRPSVADPAELAAAAWPRQAVRSAWGELLTGRPERAAQIILSAYGLDGEPPRRLAALGRL